MATLKDRGVWRQYAALLAAQEARLETMRGNDAAVLRRDVEVALVAQLGKPVFAASARDFANQFDGDWRGASDMEDSVNGALAYDRDRCVKSLCALAAAADGREYVVAVAIALEAAAQRDGEYLAQVLAGLLGKVCEAVQSAVARGDHRESPADKDGRP